MGQPRKPGEVFAIRIHNDAGYLVMPHVHPTDEHVVVVQALGGFEWEPEAQTDRERLAQIEAYKNLIQDQTRELETWTQLGDHAAKQGMTKQARFRQQMIAGMEKKLKRYKEERRQLQSTPGSSWSG